ncbi:glycosyltransferase [Bauldia sp.]|uniref:glycosyltransferase n=1 Tax=Bauldia sp. TaxID=2575872 RepID=UPI003BADA42D
MTRMIPARGTAVRSHDSIQFVIVNWNYARFVAKTIRSIATQTYPNFSCFVVDNASTDGSLEVIAEAIGDDRRFECIELDENHGQLGAILEISPRLAGDYLGLVDADDYLFPSFAAHHIAVHESLRSPVGVTCSNVVEVDGDDAVLSGRRLDFTSGDRARQSRPAEFTDAALSTDALSDRSLLRDYTTVISSLPDRWIWSPGSGNVYRRSFVQRACELVAPAVPRHHASDTLLNEVCHWLSGTALIDVPLSAYRLHDENVFASRIRIPGVRGMTRRSIERNRGQRRFIRAAMIRNRSRTRGWLATEQFWTAFDWIGANSGGLADNADLLEALTESYDQLADEFGEIGLARALLSRLPHRQFRLIPKGTPNTIKRIKRDLYYRYLFSRKHKSR